MTLSRHLSAINSPSTATYNSNPTVRPGGADGREARTKAVGGDHRDQDRAIDRGSCASPNAGTVSLANLASQSQSDIELYSHAIRRAELHHPVIQIRYDHHVGGCARRKWKLGNVESYEEIIQNTQVHCVRALGTDWNSIKLRPAAAADAAL